MFVCAFPGVVRFIRARPGGLLGTFLRTGGRRVHSGSLNSFWRSSGVVSFIHISWLRLGVPWGSSGVSGILDSFGRALVVVRFLGRAGGHQIHSGSLYLFWGSSD